MKRRTFLTGVGATLGAAAVGGPFAGCSTPTGDSGQASPGTDGSTRSTGTRPAVGNAIGPRSNEPWVLVLGGGVGGMSVAHELAERGIAVTVVERRAVPGGKARSIDVPNSSTAPRKPLPGEHGFRFFPGFYKHLPDTMKRIPYPGNAAGVFDNLVDAGGTTFARAKGKADVTLPLVKLPNDLDAIIKIFQGLFTQVFGLPGPEVTTFMLQMAKFMSSCDARRLKEYESVAWWTFTNAANSSEEFRRILAVGATRNFVASKAETASARTVALMTTQFLNQLVTAGDKLDRVLNGPTNDAWITPWREHLVKSGVDYRTDVEVKSLTVANGRITGVMVERGGATETIDIGPKSYVVSAVPVENARGLFDAKVTAAAPSLSRLAELHTEWMTGFQFFLTQPLPIVKGHVNYTESPWALTSISQAQFWPGYDLPGSFGDGKVVDVLSIDISDWEAPGIVHGKSARQSTLAEITDEVWAQVIAHLDDQSLDAKRSSLVHSSFLDPAIVFGPTGVERNDDPLLVNTVNTWAARPKATTEIPNLFLAADYVQTTIDLATMEGANEAARDATNGILDALATSERRCEKWPLEEPMFMADLREQDKERFAQGLPGPLAGL